MITAMACTMALALPGTASADSTSTGTVSADLVSRTAYPVKSAALTKNALHTIGPLPETKCVEIPIADNDRPAAQRYLSVLLDCFNATWKPAITGAGLKFTGPKLSFVKKLPRKFCGFTVDKYNSHSFYCAKTRTITYQLGKSYLTGAGDLRLMHDISMLYAEHVQNQTGIRKAWFKLPYKNEKENSEQNHRMNLQMDCLSGASVKSIWPSLHRSYHEWDGVLVSLGWSGDPWSGRGTSRQDWTARGFDTGAPSSCNTWTADRFEVL